ncbi:hypothetical protein [Flavobacterium sp.]|uniref:hypothetical protein n=1 Tax=Flavobacterium sp. TaxID=239 RepID=UPI0031DDBC8E
MKTRKINSKVNIILSFGLFFSMFYLYGQTKVNYVDRDYRIKKYQKDMIEYLIENNQFGTKSSRGIKVSEYVGKIGIVKIMEIFPISPEKNNILLVRFFSLSSHANNYWGILETNSKFLFYFNKKNNFEVDKYLERYNLKTQKIILNYIKIFDEWDQPESKENQIIDEIKN